MSEVERVGCLSGWSIVEPFFIFFLHYSELGLTVCKLCLSGCSIVEPFFHNCLHHSEFGFAHQAVTCETVVTRLISARFSVVAFFSVTFFDVVASPISN